MITPHHHHRQQPSQFAPASTSAEDHWLMWLVESALQSQQRRLRRKEAYTRLLLRLLSLVISIALRSQMPCWLQGIWLDWSASLHRQLLLIKQQQRAWQQVKQRRLGRLGEGAQAPSNQGRRAQQQQGQPIHSKPRKGGKGARHEGARHGRKAQHG